MGKHQCGFGHRGCHPPAGTRRRGETLERAILDATVLELAEGGYDALTMEGVAARAHTGKAALYRRWPAKEDLVVEALHCVLPPCGETPDTGSVRGDLIDLLTRMAVNVSTPAGSAMQRMLVNRQCGAELVETVHDRVIGPRKRMLLEALRRGAQRGEVRPDAVSMLIAEVGPAMIIQHVLAEGSPVGKEVVERIVDEVVMPLLRP